MVERYHQPLHRTFAVISRDLEENGIKTVKKHRLQMTVKAVNDTVGSEGYALTLLVLVPTLD